MLQCGDRKATRSQRKFSLIFSSWKNKLAKIYLNRSSSSYIFQLKGKQQRRHFTINIISLVTDSLKLNATFFSSSFLQKIFLLHSTVRKNATKKLFFYRKLVIRKLAARHTPKMLRFSVPVLSLLFYILTLTLQFLWQNDNGKMWKRHNLNTIFHLFVINLFTLFSRLSFCWWLNMSRRGESAEGGNGGS